MVVLQQVIDENLEDWRVAVEGNWWLTLGFPTRTTVKLKAYGDSQEMLDRLQEVLGTSIRGIPVVYTVTGAPVAL